METRSVNGITEGVIWKQLLLFFFPILFGTFFQQFYSTVDTIIVGQAVGKQALAAVGVTAPFINLLVGFFTGLASGAGVVISQYYGARDTGKVSGCVHTAVTLSLAAGVVFMAIGMLAAPWVLTVMRTPEEILAESVLYIRVYFLGMVPTLLYNMGTGILRAVGDSKRPLYFLIAASLLNIVLDVVFVVGLDMGVAGAALATVLSQVLSAALVVLGLVHSAGAPYSLDLRGLTVEPSLLREMVVIGLPAGLQSVMYTVSNLIIQAAINTFDTDAIAAWTVYGKMDCVFWMALASMGLAITTFAGQNFGARKYERIHKGLAVALGISALITALCVFVFLAFGRPLFLIFNDDPVVLEIGLDMIRFLVPSYFLYLCIEIFSGALRGTGDSLVPTILTGVGVCGLRSAWTAVAVPLRPELTTVMASYPITWAVTSLCYVVYYLRGNWLRRRIAAVEGQN